MLPELRTEAGYDFDFFDKPQQFKMQAQILEMAIETIHDLTDDEAVIRDTAFLILDSLMAVPQGMEFFQRFPKEETGQFCCLAIASRVNQLALPIVCPVCPDYDRTGYKLNNGIGLAMNRVLKHKDNLFEFFAKRNFAINIFVQVADVEALEPLILTASGETESSFRAKTNKTIKAIEKTVEGLGMAEVINVKSMLMVFNEVGLSYAELKNINSQEILNVLTRGGRKVRKAIELLVAERERLGDYELIAVERRNEMAAEELADYATFGDLVNGQAVILSPDALSAMPAYNFLRGGEKLFNPTIYLKEVKNRR